MERTNQHYRRLFSITALLVTLIGPIGQAAAQGDSVRSAPPGATPKLSAALVAAPAAAEAEEAYLTTPDGLVRVIVELADAPLTQYLAQSASSETSAPDAKAGNRLNINSADASNYRATLQRAQTSVISAIQREAGRTLPVSYRYDVAYNGFSIAVPRAQLAAIRKLPGVNSVHPVKVMSVQLDASLDLIGAKTVWTAISATQGITQPGKGIKVAVLDTGVDNTHPFFANTGVFTYPVGYPKGYCATVASFCNGKIIAARFYTQTGAVNAGEAQTPLDADGHGTHTSGTAVGNLNTLADTGFYSPTISGVAPFAYLMTYKVLWLNAAGDNASGDNDGILKGINDAIADGADVLNLSLGSPTRTAHPTDNPLNVATGNGAKVGVISVWAAGNSGPGPETIGDSGSHPDVMQIAASTTGRDFAAQLAIITSNPASVTIPLTVAALSGLSSGSGTVFAGYVDVGNVLAPLPAGSLTGKIALITRGGIARVQKTQYAADAGAIGAILRNDWQNPAAPDDLEVDDHVIPTIHMPKANAQLLMGFLGSLGPLTSTIQLQLSPSGPTFSFSPADEMAGFSSRGPSPDGTFLKPDMTAPGVNILASYRSINEPGRQWKFESGTSMAAPHVAGAAALLLSAHPEWAAIHDYGRFLRVRSALMNTSNVSVTVGGDPAALEDMGAGRAALAAALNPGLVFDPASVALGEIVLSGSRVLTVVNVTTGTLTYNFSAVKYGDPITNALYSITSTPSTLVVPAGGTMSFTLSVNATNVPAGSYQGQAYWTSGAQQLHIPYAFSKANYAFSRAPLIEAYTNQGATSFSGLIGAPVTQTVVTTYGLAAPVVVSRTIVPDTDAGDADPSTNPLDPTKGWAIITRTLASDYGRLVVMTGSPLKDVDLYVLYDSGGDGYSFPGDVIVSSTGPTANEAVQIVNAPSLRGKEIMIAVHNFTAFTGTIQAGIWEARKSNSPGLSVTGVPATLGVGDHITPVVSFSQTLPVEQYYFGLVNIGTLDSETALAETKIDVYRNQTLIFLPILRKS